MSVVITTTLLPENEDKDMKFEDKVQYFEEGLLVQQVLQARQTFNFPDPTNYNTKRRTNKLLHEVEPFKEGGALNYDPKYKSESSGELGSSLPVSYKLESTRSRIDYYKDNMYYMFSVKVLQCMEEDKVKDDDITCLKDKNGTINIEGSCIASNQDESKKIYCKLTVEPYMHVKKDKEVKNETESEVDDKKQSKDDIQGFQASNEGVVVESNTLTEQTESVQSEHEVLEESIGNDVNPATNTESTTISDKVILEQKITEVKVKEEITTKIDAPVKPIESIQSEQKVTAVAKESEVIQRSDVVSTSTSNEVIIDQTKSAVTTPNLATNPSIEPTPVIANPKQ